MDTASASIGIILMLIFVGPVVYILWQQAAKDKKRLQQLKTIEKQNILKLDQVEITSSLLLGLDTAAKKLVVIGGSINNEQQVIDLNTISKTRLKKSTESESNEETTSPTQISLDLLHGKPGNITRIVFYDANWEAGPDENTQLALAHKWEVLLGQHINSK